MANITNLSRYLDIDIKKKDKGEQKNKKDGMVLSLLSALEVEAVAPLDNAGSSRSGSIQNGIIQRGRGQRHMRQTKVIPIQSIPTIKEEKDETKHHNLSRKTKEEGGTGTMTTLERVPMRQDTVNLKQEKLDISQIKEMEGDQEKKEPEKKDLEKKGTDDDNQYRTTLSRKTQHLTPTPFTIKTQHQKHVLTSTSNQDISRSSSPPKRHTSGYNDRPDDTDQIQDE